MRLRFWQRSLTALVPLAPKGEVVRAVIPEPIRVLVPFCPFCRAEGKQSAFWKDRDAVGAEVCRQLDFYTPSGSHRFYSYWRRVCEHGHRFWLDDHAAFDSYVIRVTPPKGPTEPEPLNLYNLR